MLTNCGNEPDVEAVTLPLTFVLPVDEVMSAAPLSHSPRRVLGDPGLTETFEMPRWAYIFIVMQLNDGTVSVESRTMALDKATWRTTTYSGKLHTSGDQIYYYTSNLDILKPTTMVSGRVYVAMSNIELSLSQTKPTTEDEVKNICFKLTDEVKTNLQNIYSTPYNYNIDSEYNYSPSGTYYGQFDPTAPKVSSLNMLLYHVAARVDVMWNVQSDKYGESRLTYIDAINLYGNATDYDCLLFRPMENIRQADAAGYERNLLNNVGKSSVGMQWNGRVYFYTIPFRMNETVYFPIMLRMRQNDDATSDKDFYVRFDMNTADDDVFVPWQRCLITITGQFAPNTPATAAIKILD